MNRNRIAEVGFCNVLNTDGFGMSDMNRPAGPDVSNQYSLCKGRPFSRSDGRQHETGSGRADGARRPGHIKVSGVRYEPARRGRPETLM